MRSVLSASLLGAAVLGVCVSAGCRNVSRFSTGTGHYEGEVVSGGRDDSSFIRSNVANGTRMCMTLDTDHLQDVPGEISTSDGRFSATRLRPIPQLWHDSLSTLSFGEGRERNMLYMAADGADAGDRGDVTVVVSLMASGDVEARLVRGAPVTSSGSSGPASNIFAVFLLTQAPGSCPF